MCGDRPHMHLREDRVMVTGTNIPCINNTGVLGLVVMDTNTPCINNTGVLGLVVMCMYLHYVVAYTISAVSRWDTYPINRTSGESGSPVVT